MPLCKQASVYVEAYPSKAKKRRVLLAVAASNFVTTAIETTNDEPANGPELRRLRARIKLLEAENDDLSDENDRLWEENQILKRRRR